MSKFEEKSMSVTADKLKKGDTLKNYFLGAKVTGKLKTFNGTVHIMTNTGITIEFSPNTVVEVIRKVKVNA